MSLDYAEYYGIYTNTDLTEGRGYSILIGISKTLSGAQRYAKGRGIMGSPAEVSVVQIPIIDGIEHMPVPLTFKVVSSKEDIEQEVLTTKRNKLLDKLRQDGYSQEDLDLLK